MYQGLLTLFAGYAAWLLQIWLTWRDNFFTAKQMIEHHGKGLPMLYHTAIMWGDPFFITPFVAIVVALCGQQWSAKQVFYMSVVSFGFNAVLHYQYLQDKIQNSHMHDGWFTPAAPVHFFYGWGAFTVVGLFFGCTEGVSPSLVTCAALLLWAHVVLGTHLLVKTKSPMWFTPDQPIVDGITLGVWVVAGFFLAALTWFNLHFMH